MIARFFMVILLSIGWLVAQEASTRFELQAAANGLPVAAGGVGTPAAALERRKQYLEVLQTIMPHTTSDQLTGRINGHDKDWEEWLRRTGELPPDFASLPSVPGLPDPLLWQEGARAVPITTTQQWRRQRDWIRSQFEQWIFGTMPPAPTNLRAVVTGTRREDRVTVRDVRLEFGPEHRAVLHLQLFIPDDKGPLPVFLTNQPRNSGWIYTAVRRGYVGCLYYATDPKYGFPDDSDKFIDVYPEYDFSCLGRWAWAAMRAVDYLCTLAEVDQRKIGLAGHSRNGKQALLAAAFDERIGAVIPSSGNTGECLPWRYTTDWFSNGSIERLTGGPHNTHWFHPRLRFFSGREDKLPVDQNMLLAMVAPRGLMMYSAYAEGQGNPFGFEQAYRSARRVYQLLGHEENIWLHLRAGEHGTTSADIENFIDFLDTVFGRKTFAKSETWIHGYTFEKWRALSGVQIDPLQFPKRAIGDFVVGDLAQWQDRKQAVRRDVTWALGEEPLGLPAQNGTQLAKLGTSTDNWLAGLLRRPLKRPNMGSVILPFGDGLKADFYYPLGGDGRPRPGLWPTVVWLHSYSYHTGYSPFATGAFESLTRRGFAVLAFDQVGFGTRVLDAKDFYSRYPQWSLMGKMVSDTRAAIDAVAALEVVDRSRICLVGYGLGAKIGLVAAALDERPRAVAAVSGFDPLRLYSSEKGTEGIRHYSHLHGLMPKLGFFLGEEARLPFDFDQTLALIAPRPVLLIAPELDRYAQVDDVRRAVEGPRSIYRMLGREDALHLDTPLDFSRFLDFNRSRAPRQEQVFDWLVRQVSR